MNESESIPPGALFVDLDVHSIQWSDGRRLETHALEREDGGRLSEPCKSRVAQALGAFLQNLGVRSYSIFLGIGVRGVSIRRFQLPAGGGEHWRNLLPLQIEQEFPLPPEELAWGARRGVSNQNSAGEEQGVPVAVAALRKELLDDALALFDGLECEWTIMPGVAACAGLCPANVEDYAVLLCREKHSELMIVEQNLIASVHLLKWHDTSDPGLSSLVRELSRHWNGGALFVAGTNRPFHEDEFNAAQAFSSPVQCRRLPAGGAPVGNDVIQGFIAGLNRGRKSPWIELEIRNRPRGESRQSKILQWKWAAIAAGLAVASLCLRYAEAYLKHPGLSERLNRLQEERNRLPDVEKDLRFLQFLDENQPPYVEIVALISHAAPQGTLLGAISMNRDGDISLRGTVGNPQQANEFRSKLIATGYFRPVVLEELSPDEKKRKIAIRIVTRLKPAGSRGELPKELRAPDPVVSESSKTGGAGSSAPSTAKSPEKPNKPNPQEAGIAALPKLP